MSIPKFVALNPEVSMGEDDGSIEYYGESDLSVFDALQKFKAAHFADVAKILKTQPGETVAVDVWAVIEWECSPFGWGLDEHKGTLHLPWEAI